MFLSILFSKKRNTIPTHHLRTPYLSKTKKPIEKIEMLLQILKDSKEAK